MNSIKFGSFKEHRRRESEEKYGKYNEEGKRENKYAYVTYSFCKEQLALAADGTSADELLPVFKKT